MRLSSIANLIGGTLYGEDIDVSGVSDLENKKKGTIAYAENEKYLAELIISDVSALIIKKGMKADNKPFITVANPKLSFSKVLTEFSPYQPYPAKVYPNTYIEPSTKLGKNVTIMPFATIMDNAEIGDNTVIYSNVFIGKNAKIGKNCIIKAGIFIDDNTIIGDNVIIHPNCVIGGDGYGYVFDGTKHDKIPQIGRIKIEDNTEIGCGVTIDKATMGETVIGKGVKIDNLVHIAHNVTIGENSLIIAQTGIAGSSHIGKNTILAGQVGISDHVNIGDNVIIMAGSKAETNLESGKVYYGHPAKEYISVRRQQVYITKIPEIMKKVKELEKKLDDNGNK